MFRKRSAGGHSESGERDTARLEAFSDGVFAIAITLLILEIQVPTVEEISGHSTLWRALFELWPSFLGYLISFLVIGIMWVNHHTIFRCIRYVDRWLLFINLLLLLCIAFIPFPTALLAEYITHPYERTALLFYCGVLFMTSFAFNLLWRYPTLLAQWLLEPDLDPQTIAGISWRTLSGMPIYLAVAVVCWFSPTIGLIALGLTALLYLAPTSLGRAPEHPAGSPEGQS